MYVELPENNKVYNKGEVTAGIESVKTASDVYTPVSGEIFEVNEDLSDSPQMVNEGAETDAWLFKIKLSTQAEFDKLMSED